MLITIDEADNSESMKYFIQAYQSFIRQGYPILFLMTGLFDNISKLQDDKSLTFLYRTPKIFLGPLSLPLIASSYRKYLKDYFEKSIALVNLIKGFPFAYQTLGNILFKSKIDEINDEILDEYDSSLFEFVYDKLFSELSSLEQSSLLSIPNNNKNKVSNLINLSGLYNKTFGVYRDRLIKKGILNSPTFVIESLHYKIF